MTYEPPRCLAQYQPWGTPPAGVEPMRCQLDAGHDGDHLNSHEHANAIHTISWTDHIDELAQLHGWQRK